MKKYITFCLAAIIMAACDPTGAKGGDDQPEQPGKPEIEWRDTYNGTLLTILSDAYATWETKNALPTVVKWEGIGVYKPECLRAGMTLLLKMEEDPENWMMEDVTYPAASTTIIREKAEPFLPREIKFSEVLDAVKTVHSEMVETGVTPMRVKVGSYDNPMTSEALLVTICRAFAYYDANESFPETIDVWESSFCASTNNCKIDAPEVQQARDAAFKAAGITETSTDRQKAVAIFNYARDNWTWENYNNTKRGAAKTIKDKAGNCCDLSHAIVAMARLSGIPARYFHAQCKYSSGYIGHVISQLFVDGEWHMADASNDSNSFGTVTFNGYTNDELIEELEW